MNGVKAAKRWRFGVALAATGSLFSGACSAFAGRDSIYTKCPEDPEWPIALIEVERIGDTPLHDTSSASPDLVWEVDGKYEQQTLDHAALKVIEDVSLQLQLEGG